MQQENPVSDGTSPRHAVAVIATLCSVATITVVGCRPTATVDPAPPAPPEPERLDRAGIEAGLAPVRDELNGCMSVARRGRVRVDVAVDRGGTPTSISVDAPSDAIELCLTRALERTRYRTTPNGARFAYVVLLEP